MSSVTGYFNNAAGIAEAGYGLYGQIDRALHGDKYKVHFVQNNKTLVEFDACINESHSQQAEATKFPTLSGAVVSDHIVVAPLELKITGVVTDSPITASPDILNQTVIAGQNAIASRLAGALGIVGVAAFSALAAQRGSQSRSLAAYAQLSLMVSGYVNGYQVNQPAIFDVVTRLRSYTSMVLREVTVDRDASTGNALVFSMGLLQIRQATYATATVKVAAKPSAAAQKAFNAEQEKEQEQFSQNNLFSRGRADVANGTLLNSDSIAAIKGAP